MARLGCGQWRAVVQCRGGGELGELPFSALSLGRRIDDMSEASLTVPGPQRTSLSPTAYAQCCGLLADLEAWEHELALFRGTDPTSADADWVGPIIKITRRVDELVIAARDLFQWFERRLLERDHDFVATDLADIFKTYAVDALHRDPSPHPDLSSISATGIYGDRSLKAAAGRRAADELRELARSGLDFTMVGRTMLTGGTTIPTGDLGVLITEHFDGPESVEDGLQTETETTVIGAPLNVIGGTVRASAGGVDPDRGLVQGAVVESTIRDENSAMALAGSRQALLSETPTFLTGRLLEDAPVSFAELIPGATADLRVQLLCDTVEGMHRLMAVDVQVDDAGVESVNVTFSSLGTSEEDLGLTSYTPIVLRSGYVEFDGDAAPSADQLQHVTLTPAEGDMDYLVVTVQSTSVGDPIDEVAESSIVVTNQADNGFDLVRPVSPGAGFTTRVDWFLVRP